MLYRGIKGVSQILKDPTVETELRFLSTLENSPRPPREHHWLPTVTLDSFQPLVSQLFRLRIAMSKSSSLIVLNVWAPHWAIIKGKNARQTGLEAG